MLALTIARPIYILKKAYFVLSEKPLENKVKELENYKVDDMMNKTIVLAYMKDDLIIFFEHYKTTDMFDAIKVKYSIDIATHVQVLL